MIGRLIFIVGVLAFVVVVVVACAPKPPPTVTVINCPQPTAEAISRPNPRPQVPTLSTNPGEAIGQLGVVIAEDDAWADNEVRKREALINHGVERCRWTR